MSLNGFFARAKMKLGKLVPSFGYGGGQQSITDFFGCAEADLEPAFRAEADVDSTAVADADVEPAFIATASVIGFEADADVEAAFLAVAGMEGC